MAEKQRVALEIGTYAPELRAIQRQDGGEISLTPSEARLFAWLCEHPREIVTVERLLSEVWGYSGRVESRTAYVTIGRLRQKIERDPSKPRHIVAAAGAGYRFEPLPDEAPPVTPDGYTLWGRERELGQIAAWRAQGRDRIVLLGPGGVGKTSLARAALGEPSEGHVLCDASGAADLEGLLFAVYRALSLPMPSSGQRTRLRASLAARGGLLLLDNVEAVAEQARELLDEWKGCGVTVIATSRVAIGAGGEQVLPVEPLDGSAAVSLFLERARAARRGLPDGAETAALAAEIASVLDGIPLCLQLAAARVRSLSLADLLERLKQRPLDLLASEEETSRHRTLRSAVAWSVELLPGWARDSFAALSSMRGPFSLSRAESLLDPSLFGGPWAGDVLQTLVDASLVGLDTAADERSEALYRWLPSLRLIAEELSRDLPQREILRERHARSFAVSWPAARVQALSSGEAPLRAELLREGPDLMAALGWAVEAQDAEVLSPVLRAVDRLARTQGCTEATAALVRRAAEIPGLPPSLALAAAVSRADLALSRGRPQEVPDLEALLARYPDADPAERFAAKQCLLFAAEIAGEIDRMSVIADEIAAMGPQISAGAAAEGYRQRGALRQARGDLAGAESDLLEALARAREAGNERVVGAILLGLGSLYDDRGDLARAEPCIRQSIAIAERLQERDQLPRARRLLGDLCYGRGQLAEACAHMQDGFTLAQRLGLLPHAASCGMTYARALVQAGQSARAEEVMREVLQIPMPPHLKIAGRAVRGWALSDLGRAVEARVDLASAVEEALSMGAPYAEILARDALARLLQPSEPEAAIAHARASLAVAERMGATPARIEASALLAWLLASAGRREESCALLDTLSSEALSAIPPLQRALALLDAASCAVVLLLHDRAKRLIAEADALIAGMDLGEGALARRRLAALRPIEPHAAGSSPTLTGPRRR